MIKPYHYEITQFAVTGQKLVTEGYVNGDVADGSVYVAAMRQSFQQVTQGKAVFGDPSTCHGPYRITRIVIEEIDDKDIDTV